MRRVSTVNAMKAVKKLNESKNVHDINTEEQKVKRVHAKNALLIVVVDCVVPKDVGGARGAEPLIRLGDGGARGVHTWQVAAMLRSKCVCECECVCVCV